MGGRTAESLSLPLPTHNRYWGINNKKATVEECAEHCKRHMPNTVDGEWEGASCLVEACPVVRDFSCCNARNPLRDPKCDIAARQWTADTMLATVGIHLVQCRLSCSFKLSGLLALPFIVAPSCLGLVRFAVTASRVRLIPVNGLPSPYRSWCRW